MKRFILAVLVLALSIGLVPQAARAQDTNSWNAFWAWLSRGQDPRLTAVGLGIGIAGDAVSWDVTRKHGYPPVRAMTPLGAYAATAAGCVIAYPFVATIVINRMLTPREAYTGMANCVIPFIGGWIVDAALPHDAWTDGTPPAPTKHHK
jgi:hypothetical protein